MMTLDFSKYSSLRGFIFSHMNSFISLQKAIYKPDGFGGMDEEWQNVGGMWAKIIPMSNFKNTDLYRKKVNAWIVVRYNPDISGDMRIISNDVIYDIGHIMNMDSRFIIMSAMEGNHYV